MQLTIRDLGEYHTQALSIRTKDMNKVLKLLEAAGVPYYQEESACDLAIANEVGHQVVSNNIDEVITQAVVETLAEHMWDDLSNSIDTKLEYFADNK